MVHHFIQLISYFLILIWASDFTCIQSVLTHILLDATVLASLASSLIRVILLKNFWHIQTWMSHVKEQSNEGNVDFMFINTIIIWLLSGGDESVVLFQLTTKLSFPLLIFVECREFATSRRSTEMDSEVASPQKRRQLLVWPMNKFIIWTTATTHQYRYHIHSYE